MAAAASQPPPPPGRTTLVLGDENLTFVLPFLESRHHWPDETVEVGLCLPEEKLPDDTRPNYLSVQACGIKIHFGVNPAQLRNYFFSGEYDRIIFILPGIATCGFPDFLDKKHDMLFRLRLHIYFFGFLKSSRTALKADTGMVQLLWPTQSVDGQLGPEVPWHGVEINKIGPFCDVHRRSDFDEPLDYEKFAEWRPLIHGVTSEICPPYLINSTFYSWSLSPSPTSPLMLPEAGDAAHKDQNLLFVPPQLWSHSAESISHVNELFNFQLPTNVPDELLVVSRPTLKFDPRFRNEGSTTRLVPRRATAPPPMLATAAGAGLTTAIPPMVAMMPPAGMVPPPPPPGAFPPHTMMRPPPHGNFDAYMMMQHTHQSAVPSAYFSTQQQASSTHAFDLLSRDRELGIAPIEPPFSAAAVNDPLGGIGGAAVTRGAAGSGLGDAALASFYDGLQEGPAPTTVTATAPATSSITSAEEALPVRDGSSDSMIRNRRRDFSKSPGRPSREKEEEEPPPPRRSRRSRSPRKRARNFSPVTDRKRTGGDSTRFRDDRYYDGGRRSWERDRSYERYRSNRDDGRSSRDEGRSNRDDGRSNRDDGRSNRDDGRSTKGDIDGRPLRDSGRSFYHRDEGRSLSKRDEGHSSRDERRLSREEFRKDVDSRSKHSGEVCGGGGRRYSWEADNKPPLDDTRSKIHSNKLSNSVTAGARDSSLRDLSLRDANVRDSSFRDTRDSTLRDAGTRYNGPSRADRVSNETSANLSRKSRSDMSFRDNRDRGERRKDRQQEYAPPQQQHSSSAAPERMVLPPRQQSRYNEYASRDSPGRRSRRR